MTNPNIATLRQTLRGGLIEKDDPDYAEARKLYNGMIDKRPLMIARCTDVADVIAMVRSRARAAISSQSAAAAITGRGWAVATMASSLTFRR